MTGKKGLAMTGKKGLGTSSAISCYNGAMTGEEAGNDNKEGRNDALHYVIARHISAEAIPHLSSPLKGEE